MRVYLPSFALITEGKVQDVKMAHLLSLDPGTIVVDDRGYYDYRLFAKWTEQGIYFVTRVEDNALYPVVEDCLVPQRRLVRKDQIICLSGTRAAEKCPNPLRRVEVFNLEKEEILVF